MADDNLLENWDLETGAPSTVMKRAPGRGPRIAKYLAKSSTGQDCGWRDTKLEKGEKNGSYV